MIMMMVDDDGIDDDGTDDDGIDDDGIDDGTDDDGIDDDDDNGRGVGGNDNEVSNIKKLSLVPYSRLKRLFLLVVN